VVVVERAVTEVPRPTLFDIVIVWEEVTVGRLVKISSSSVLPSLQDATEKVNLKLDAWMRDRELQFLNMLVKVPDEETAVRTRAGTLDRDWQPSTRLVALVTAAVLNNGMVVKDVQLPSMPSMFVTSAVLNKGRLVRETQLENITNIDVTAAVLNNGT
jgi:hypothetical protein